MQPYWVAFKGGGDIDAWPHWEIFTGQWATTTKLWRVIWSLFMIMSPVPQWFTIWWLPGICMTTRITKSTLQKLYPLKLNVQTTHPVQCSDDQCQKCEKCPTVSNILLFVRISQENYQPMNIGKGFYNYRSILVTQQLFVWPPNKVPQFHKTVQNNCLLLLCNKGAQFYIAICIICSHVI